MAQLPSQPTLAWTGERMIPGQCDPATEMFHYQRYLYFRPWYAGKKVIDAASGEGYGTYYASAFAEEAHGFDIAADAVKYARSRYKGARYDQKDCCEVDYSTADLVVSFETIEHLPDPAKFLKALNACKGAIVISTPNRTLVSPGNKLEDKPLNPHHTVEWSAEEFCELIKASFPGRKVRFLSQPMRWPGTMTEGFDENSMFLLAVIDGGELPKWPSIGMAIPTRSAARALAATTVLSKLYPGEMTFALVANGCPAADITALRNYADENPHLVHVIANERNTGYGAGANAGLQLLSHKGYDLYGVSNDDVYPAVDCLCEMVNAYQELETRGLRPGMIGPVSNCVNGAQEVKIGDYKDVDGLLRMSETYHKKKCNSVTDALQVRGLCFLMPSEALKKVGGFDPRFGFGNFEDDDLNLRLRAAGYSLWIAEGAFLHHDGSKTFKEIGLDYSQSIQRNLQLILEKYRTDDFVALIQQGIPIPNFDVHQPLTALPQQSGLVANFSGEPVDLIYQASNLEFATWLTGILATGPREARLSFIKSLEQLAAA